MTMNDNAQVNGILAICCFGLAQEEGKEEEAMEVGIKYLKRACSGDNIQFKHVRYGYDLMIKYGRWKECLECVENYVQNNRDDVRGRRLLANLIEQIDGRDDDWYFCIETILELDIACNLQNELIPYLNRLASRNGKATFTLETLKEILFLLRFIDRFLKETFLWKRLLEKTIQAKYESIDLSSLEWQARSEWFWDYHLNRIDSNLFASGEFDDVKERTLYKFALRSHCASHFPIVKEAKKAKKKLLKISKAKQLYESIRCRDD